MGLSVTSAAVSDVSISKSYAVPVRCVVDVSYIRKGGTLFSNGSILKDKIKP